MQEMEEKRKRRSFWLAWLFTLLALIVYFGAMYVIWKR